MSNNGRKILVLVEGAKTDARLMEHLINVYGLDSKHEVVPYGTHIYALYNAMKRDGTPDILLHLRKREPDADKKLMFDEKYTDILLMFDLDPHDSQFSEATIREMANYFTESTDMGKLYINYPMVEAFYHMQDIPDPAYNTRVVHMSELTPKNLYKEKVRVECRNGDPRKFAVSKRECSTVIHQNIEKAHHITNRTSTTLVPDSTDILEAQLANLKTERTIAVLCTCAFYIPDYNPRLLED